MVSTMAVVSAVAVLVVLAVPSSAFLPPTDVLLQTSAEMPSDVQGKYHTVDQIYSELESLATNCGVLSVSNLMVEGTSEKVFTLQSSGDSSSTQKLLVNFNMHGREMITGETALQLAKSACQDDGRLGSVYTKAQVQEVLKKTTIKFIPVLNKAGRKRADNPQGQSCTDQRKNSNLVDPNRNFLEHWEANNDVNGETFSGNSPMSEYENKLMDQLADSFNSAAPTNLAFAYLDVHAGEDAMGWPYGYSQSDSIPEAKTNRYKAVTSAINDKAFGEGNHRWAGTLSSMGGASAYNSLGCACDYFYSKSYVDLAMTWEIWRERYPYAKAQLNAQLTRRDNSAMTPPVTLGKVFTDTPSLELAPTAPLKVIPDSKSALRVLSSLVQQDEGVETAAQEETPTPSESTTDEKQVNFIADEEKLASEATQHAAPAVAEPPMGSNALMPQPALANKELNTIQASTAASAESQASASASAAAESKVEASTEAKSGAEASSSDMNVEDCFKYFNPVTANDYDKTVREWSDAIITLANQNFRQ